jgi:hypothetical protein
MSYSNHNPFLNFYPSQASQGQMNQGQGQTGQAQNQTWPGQQMAQQPTSFLGQPQYQGSYPGMGQYPQNLNSTRPQSASLLNDRFFKGLLIGAAAAYLLTNESVQRTAIKGAVKAWSLMQGGVEELKERFHDAEAELRSESGD